MTDPNPLSSSYDRVAAEYTARIADELAGKPLDRALLRAFAEQVGPLGPLADLGCGPGQVAAFLAEAGSEVVGFDLSSGMIEQARLRYPKLTFRQGDLRSLPASDAAFGGIVAFYSIIHLLPAERVPAFREWRRVLRPGGFALVAFHIGDSVTHFDEWWDRPVDLDFHFLEPEAVAAELIEAGFTIEATLRRAPYAGVEHPNERGYVLARRST
ncbi:MAG TPA: methyltransferase domain-containing protein [Roseiflexaceae bacterium]|nr:methyltransferase domain-containing protein [Roseiflexaceae bacterium]